jgi:SAM-dependent methyltransferase
MNGRRASLPDWWSRLKDADRLSPVRVGDEILNTLASCASQFEGRSLECPAPIYPTPRRDEEYLLDISTDVLTNATRDQEGYRHPICGSIFDLPFAECAFVVIGLAAYAGQMFNGRFEFLSEFYRCLAPGGLLTGVWLVEADTHGAETGLPSSIVRTQGGAIESEYAFGNHELSVARRVEGSLSDEMVEEWTISPVPKDALLAIIASFGFDNLRIECSAASGFNGLEIVAITAMKPTMRAHTC